MRSTTSPRTYGADAVRSCSDPAQTYGQEVERPRRHHGKVDERAEATADGDEQNGDGRL